MAADGPRSDREGEAEKVMAVRDYVLSNVDWQCEVKTLFRDKNLGCKYAVSKAITWFFEQEEMGIILEDDCLPSQSFFWFCEELLEKYKDDLRIWHITGNNCLTTCKQYERYSFFFGGIYGSIWGWATWRSRWADYDVKMLDYQELKSKKYLENCYNGNTAVKKRINDFDAIINGLDTWDYQWVFTRWKNNGLTIIPFCNLIKNIGFGDDATHTCLKNDSRRDMEIYEISFPLKIPNFVIRNTVLENKFYETFIKKTIKKRIINFINRICRRIDG